MDIPALLKRLFILSSLNDLCNLVKNWPHTHGSASGFSVLFHWSIGLTLHLHQCPDEPSMSLEALFFIQKCLAILIVLFYINFMNSLIFYKYSCWDFECFVETKDHFGKKWDVNIEYFTPRTWSILKSSLSLLMFLHFTYRSCIYLLHFMLCGAIVNGNCKNLFLNVHCYYVKI